MRLAAISEGRRALSERDWGTLDRLLVAALALMGVIEVASLQDVTGPRWLNFALVIAMALSLLLRRSRPFLALVLVLGIGVLGEAVALGPPDLLSMVFMLIAATYSMGAHAERNRALIGIAVAVPGVIVIAALFDPGDIFFPVALLRGRPLAGGAGPARTS